MFTGDLADRGEPAASRHLREMVEPFAERIGAQVVWCMGNHDDRAAYAPEGLYDAEVLDLAHFDRAHFDRAHFDRVCAPSTA